MQVYAADVSRDIEIQGWGRNSNRNASLYIYPNKDTSFSHVDRKICCKVKPLVVVVVCSNTQNSQLREAIRQTWARDALVYNMLVFFLVGISHSEAVNMNTLKESIIHKDIIVEEVIENYNNLTLKSIFMLKWVKMNCAEARFLLKVDDDVYLNVTNLHNYASNVADDKMANFLVGYIQEYPYPYRYHYSKWYIPRYLFAKDEYPPYVQGGAYLMSFQVARKLYYESFENELIHIEDAFITGTMAGVESRTDSGLRRVRRFADFRNFNYECLFYKIVDRQIGHDVAFRRKAARRILVVVIVLFLVVLLKVLNVYFTRDIELLGWGRNMNRNATHYIFPNKETSFSHADRGICSYMKPLVVIVVCSDPRRFELRKAIRETWAKDVQRRNILLFFMVGSSSDEEVNMNTLKESTTHKDIIAEELLDTYNNLTLKSIFMLKWVKKNCAETRFVMKVDDDVYINVSNLHKYVSNVDSNEMANFLVGYMQSDSRPHRCHFSKWYIPRYLYPKDEYPPYVHGVAYLMSSQVAKKLYYESLQTEMIHLEDVFITGMCAEKVGVIPTDEPLFHFYHRPIFMRCNSIDAELIVVGHYVDAYRIHKIHDQLTTC